jgi:hypothetical protein
MICRVNPILNGIYNVCTISQDLNKLKSQSPTDNAVIEYLGSPQIKGHLEQLKKQLKKVLDKDIVADLFQSFQKYHGM